MRKVLPGVLTAAALITLGSMTPADAAPAKPARPPLVTIATDLAMPTAEGTCIFWVVWRATDATDVVGYSYTVGLTPPQKGKLTYEQVGSPTTVYAIETTPDETVYVSVALHYANGKTSKATQATIPWPC